MSYNLYVHLKFSETLTFSLKTLQSLYSTQDSMRGPPLLLRYSLTSRLFKFSTVPISEGAGESSRAIKRGMMEGREEFKKMTGRKEWTCYGAETIPLACATGMSQAFAAQ